MCILALLIGGCGGATEGSQTGRLVKFHFIARDEKQVLRSNVAVSVQSDLAARTDFLTDENGEATGPAPIFGPLRLIVVDRTQISEHFNLGVVPDAVSELTFNLKVDEQSKIITIEEPFGIEVNSTDQSSSLDPAADGSSSDTKSPPGNGSPNGSSPTPQANDTPTPSVPVPADSPTPTSTPTQEGLGHSPAGAGNSTGSAPNIPSGNAPTPFPTDNPLPGLIPPSGHNANAPSS